MQLASKKGTFFISLQMILGNVGDEDSSPIHFRENSMHHNQVAKLGKIIGTDEKVDLKDLMQAMKSSFKLGTHHPELTD